MVFLSQNYQQVIMAGEKDIGQFDLGGVQRPQRSELQPWQYEPRRLLLLPLGEYRLPLLREETDYPVNGESPSNHRHYVVVSQDFSPKRKEMIGAGLVSLEQSLQANMPVITTVPSGILGRVDDFVISNLFVYDQGICVPRHYRLGQTIALASLELVVNPRML